MAELRLLSEAGLRKALATEPVLKHLMGIGFKIEARAKGLTNNVMVGVVTGRLSGSITTVAAQRNGGPVVLVGTNVEYAIYVHEGTRPHWPPRAPIAAWLGAKGGDPRQAFLVQRAISRRGTPPRPFLLQAMREVVAR